MRALPKMLTAGRTRFSRSVASANSAIIPNTRHASRPDQGFSISSGASSLGILSPGFIVGDGLDGVSSGLSMEPVDAQAGAFFTPAGPLAYENPASGRRVVLPVSRFPRAARPAQPAPASPPAPSTACSTCCAACTRTIRRIIARAFSTPKAGPSATRSTRPIQGQPPADARRSRRADRTAARMHPRHGLAAARSRGRGGGRRHRHAGRAGAGARGAHADLLRRQGPHPARRSAW